MTYAALLSDSDLPETLAHLQKQTYQVEQRNRGDSDGAITNAWKYTDISGDHCHIACDHAFSAWHSLEVCYIGRGWQVDSKQVVGNLNESWPAVEVHFSNDAGRKAWLIYSLFNSAGDPVQPPEASVSASMLDRLFHKGPLGDDHSLYQTQVFVEVPVRMPDEVRRQYLDAHVKSRSLLRDSLIRRIQEGA